MYIHDGASFHTFDTCCNMGLVENLVIFIHICGNPSLDLAFLNVL